MKKILYAAVSCLIAAGCVTEGDYATVIVPSSEETEKSMEVSLSFEGAFEADTRSILGNGIDSVVSGAVVGVYNASTGILDSVWETGDFSSPLDMRLPKSSTLDIYVIGNMWYLDSSGARVGPSFPKKETDLASMVYRMDGSKSSPGRTETFAEASEYGIPMVGVLKGITPSKTPVVSVEMRRLFAKVTLTIDHSGLDGGGSADRFKNVSLYLRQANVKLTPFASSSKSVKETDVISKSDYDASMTNGHALTYTFYVPENRHGAYQTYVEFSGKVDPSAGGYGGTVCYRFYIGSGADGDYDVEGNQNYRVTLGFKAGSLFDPQWKVSVGDDWKDGRKFCLAKDSAGSGRLSASSVIAVRKGRAATCWLYYNRKGSGTNEASTLKSCNGSFEPSDLTESAWWCEAPDLAKYGITLTVSGNKLTFKVTDKTKFVSGKTIPLKLHLYPGDTVSEASLTTYDDISVKVSDGLSLTEGFYTGMKRTIRVSGLAGSKIYYWNAYGVDRLTLKAATSEDSDWIHNAKSSSQTIAAGNPLDLCAYNQSGGDQFILALVSNDTFNDGSQIYRDKVIVKAPRMTAYGGNVYLPFDGRGVKVPFDYLTEEDEVIPEESFDRAIYSQILMPGIVWTEALSSQLSSWIGNDGMEVYLKNYYNGGAFIGDGITKYSGFLGPVSFGPADRTLAYGNTQVMLFAHIPVWSGGFSDLYSDYFNTKGASDMTASAVAMIHDDTPYAIEISGGNSSDVRVDVGDVSDSRIQLIWKFSDTGRIPDGLAPVGPQNVSLVFTNIRSGEKYRLSSSFNVHHLVTLRPFVLFTQGASTAEVLATTAKNAWILERYCARESGVPRATGFLGLSGVTFPSYVTMKYSRAIKKNRTETEVYRGSCSMAGRYQYQDYDPSAYGKGYTWTSARISAFSAAGANALSYLGFCGPASSYTPLTTPLPASYVGGSQYIQLRASSSSLGCATLP